MYKILIVEDEKLIRKRLIFGIDFEKINCVVIGEARDGKEGEKAIKTLNPDIILTDINMPIMSGFDMLEATMDFNYSTIILSGYNEFKNAQRAIKYGVTEFVVKPIQESDIIEAVERAKKQVDERNILLKLKNIHFLDEEYSVIGDSFNNSKDIVVQEMLQYVTNNYNRKFLFSEVSKELGYSPTVLHERFKKETTITFNDYLNRYRINQSIQMLKNGNKKLYEISEECGFSEYKYYNKVFKKYIGMSTSEFLEYM